MMEALFAKTKEKMEKCLDALERDYKAIRAGRANPAILDKVMVDYYGCATPINQMAAISVPEPRMLMIQPWDASTLKEIEKAINTSDIGINPSNDGKVIRLSFPPLTEDRRKELVKDISKRAEEAKVAIRNVRRDAMDDLKKLKKDNEITEDDQKNGEKKLQDITDSYIKQSEEIEKKKEQEILALILKWPRGWAHTGHFSGGSVPISMWPHTVHTHTFTSLRRNTSPFSMRSMSRSKRS